MSNSEPVDLHAAWRAVVDQNANMGATADRGEAPDGGPYERAVVAFVHALRESAPNGPRRSPEFSTKRRFNEVAHYLNDAAAKAQKLSEEKGESYGG